MTTSIRSYFESAISRIGLEMTFEKQSQMENQRYLIRFVGLSEDQNFSLELNHAWALTQVKFIPDPFAGEVVNYLVSQIIENIESLVAFVKDKSDQYSNLDIYVNGSRLDENPVLGQPDQQELRFEVGVLTNISQLQFGLLEKREIQLLDFVIDFFSLLLPSNSYGYRSPDEVRGYPEGTATQVTVNKYERDPRNREEAIKYHGLKCLACGFDFASTYGPLGSSFIVVHHITPVSQLGEDYVIDPREDLVTICANCHAMIHRKNPPYSVQEIKDILKTTKDERIPLI